jgi:hypothetical protein
MTHVPSRANGREPAVRKLAAPGYGTRVLPYSSPIDCLKDRLTSSSRRRSCSSHFQQQGAAARHPIPSTPTWPCSRSGAGAYEQDVKHSGKAALDVNAKAARSAGGRTQCPRSSRVYDATSLCGGALLRNERGGLAVNSRRDAGPHRGVAGVATDFAPRRGPPTTAAAGHRRRRAGTSGTKAPSDRRDTQALEGLRSFRLHARTHRRDPVFTQGAGGAYHCVRGASRLPTILSIAASATCCSIKRPRRPHRRKPNKRLHDPLL